MKAMVFIFGVLTLALVCAGVSAQPALTAATLPLKDVIKVGDRTLAVSQSEEIQLPPLTGRPGAVLVLRLRAVSYTEQMAGSNWNLALTLNGLPLARYTVSGRERLLGRSPAFHFGGYTHSDSSVAWQIFSGPQIHLMLAPDISTGDSMTDDGLGATFALDISDVARGVDGNTLKIINLRRPPGAGEKDLIVRDIEIGWLDKALLPKDPDRMPQRTAMKDAVSLDGLRLAQGAAGGFSVASSDGVELLVETVIGMKRDAESELIACDALKEGQKAKISVLREGPCGYRITVVWPEVSLVRTIALADGLVYWKERWTNTGKTILGVPFRHRLFLRGEKAQGWIAGTTDADALAGVAQNPTVFLRSNKADGKGMGVTLESDWLRLLARLGWDGGLGEVYTEDLALPPGGSIDFALTITPVKDGGGYWSFINSVRRRWGVNGGTADRPMFWNWSGKDRTPEGLQKDFGHLGPVAFVAWINTDTPGHNWGRLSFDQGALFSKQYPKLPPDAPRTPGKTPDLDVDAFLTFAHREKYWKDYADYVALVQRVLPKAQVLMAFHPAIEATYLPMAYRWPDAEDVIRTATGALFESGTYTRALMGDWVEKDWVALYHVPRPSSAHLEILLRDMGRSIDACGGGGIYNDEFTWAYGTRGYSRYDYSRWDGYSADLDADGKVVQLKSDNGFTTESAQLQTVEKIRQRGKFFMGNGAPALRSVNDLHAEHFVEGGNGPASWSLAHLVSVPLVMGNFGDSSRRKGVFENVKMVLEGGCIYSPYSCNRVLDGSDNFVSKLYPITIRAIGPGVIEGEQRLITTHSGSFKWPGRDATVTLYAYDENGDLMNRTTLTKVKTDAAGMLTITVPPNGMVIAEL